MQHLVTITALALMRSNARDRGWRENATEVSHFPRSLVVVASLNGVDFYYDSLSTFSGWWMEVL
jgi:hypothetical protein